MNNKTYKYFLKFTNSKSILLCKRNWIVGPDYKNIIGTFLLINISSIIFLIYYERNLFFYFEIILLLLINIFMLITSFKDPGIVPKFFEKNNWNNKNKYSKNIYMNYNGDIYNFKKCFSCNNYRSFKTVHCYICNNCVLNYDHHCPWWSNCIGKRNYFYFILFVIFLFIYCYLLFINIILNFINQFKTNLSTLNIIIFILFVLIIFFGVLFSSSLFFFHFFLIFKNYSTNQYLKSLRIKQKYSFEWLKNINKLSYLNFNLNYSNNSEFVEFNTSLKNSPFSCFKNNKIDQFK